MTTWFLRKPVFIKGHKNKQKRIEIFFILQLCLLVSQVSYISDKSGHSEFPSEFTLLLFHFHQRIMSKYHWHFLIFFSYNSNFYFCNYEFYQTILTLFTIPRIYTFVLAFIFTWISSLYRLYIFFFYTELWVYVFVFLTWKLEGKRKLLLFNLNVQISLSQFWLNILQIWLDISQNVELKSQSPHYPEVETSFNRFHCLTG